MLVPICFLNKYLDRLTIKVNNFLGGQEFAGGYKNIYWYSESKPNDRHMSKLTNNTAIITGFSTDYVIFQTENPITGALSDKISVYFQNDPIDFEVNRLWRSAHIPDTDYTQELKEKLISERTESPETSLLYILYDIYQNIEDRETFEEDIFYTLLVWQENYHNLTMSNLNRLSPIGFSRFRTLPKPEIDTSLMVDVIKIYKLIDNERQLFKVIRTSDFPLSLELEEGFYDIRLYKDNELIVCFEHVRPSEEYLKRLWNSGLTALQEYQDAVEDTMITRAEFVDMTTDEIRQYKEELKFTPKNPIFPRIKVKESDIFREVQLFVKGVTLAAHSHRAFYISGKDVDFLEEEVNNQFFPVAGKADEFTVRFDPARNLLADQALLYIADEDGNIVSRITRCLFDEDPTTSLVDYYKNIRDAEIKVILDRIHKLVLEDYPLGLEMFDEIGYQAQQNEDVDLDNIHESLINLVLTLDSSIDKDLLTFTILKDWMSNSEYDLSFFENGGLTWHPYTYSLVTKESYEGYILCILACYNGETTYHKHYVKSQEEGSTEVILNNFGRYIVWAIDEKNYTYSGFLYLNTVNKYRRTFCLNMVVE